MTTTTNDDDRRLAKSKEKAVARAAVALACAAPEEFREQIAEAPTTAQPAMGEPEQISTPSNSSTAHVAEDGIKPILDSGGANDRPEPPHAFTYTPDIIDPAAPLGSDAALREFETGAAAARALLTKTIGGDAGMREYESGAAAARALFGQFAGSDAEKRKFEAGAAAARALLGPVAGSEAELAKFNAGQDRRGQIARQDRDDPRSELMVTMSE